MSDVAKPPRTWDFGDWSLDRHNKEIILPSGSREALNPKEFAVLDFLILHQNDFYDSKQLVDAVWKEAVIPNNAEVRIASIRKKLKRLQLDDERIIRQERGKGFRFLLTPILPPST